MSNAISVELAEFLVSAAEESSGDIGIDASYSGRCMYGQTCLGLTFESVQSAFGLIPSNQAFAPLVYADRFCVYSNKSNRSTCGNDHRTVWEKRGRARIHQGERT